MGDYGAVINFTEQMKGMALGGDSPPLSRAGKKKNQYACHDIEHSSNSSTAFNERALHMIIECCPDLVM